MTTVRLECQIQKCVDELSDLVSGKGLMLTDPKVVGKSMELDQLILRAMHESHPMRQTS
ncbi:MULTISPECIES: aspartyl-phosphate phosphatase Spo0E family protein [unclassified Paenibacillus]|uniref:aspartyl-phosphate phosphatase Spo0E family protein n=1 Tax=unclassified Paenibacillus TaxID=185978 RepID=UPI000931715D|nr:MULTISPECIES: aspartyl-phosphate phosphatase Spo0E family protein [unclassified Paenibacillus]